MLAGRVSLPKTTHLHWISVFIKDMNDWWIFLRRILLYSKSRIECVCAVDVFSWSLTLSAFLLKTFSTLCHLDPEQAFLWTVAQDPLVLPRVLQTLSSAFISWGGPALVCSKVLWPLVTVMEVFYWTFMTLTIHMNLKSLCFVICNCASNEFSHSVCVVECVF